MRRLYFFFLWALCACGWNAPAWAEQTYRVGITAFRDKDATVREWQPTLDLLSDQIPNTHFEVVPLNLPEFESALQAKSLDFLITNPQHYIAVESRYGVSRVATLVRSESGQIVNQFGGVIFTRSDRADIAQLAHIKGKRVAATDKTSFAAYLVEFDVLMQQGIDLAKDAEVSFLGFPQDLSVKAVLDGRADVGFARSGLLESMAREGKLELSDIKVLNQMPHPGFPFVVSSPLYPEWPLAAAPHVPIDITNRVVAALLLMSPNSEAAKRGRYFRWSTPVEYQSVQALMRRRHVYPFDQPEPVTLQDVMREYASPMVLGALGVMLVMGLLYGRSYQLNRQLIQSRQDLRQMAHHDALTGLPNRNLLTDRLEQSLAHARRTGHALALCMLDLDGFKPVNDQFGHAVGDQVLVEIAHRLKTAVRDGDTVARFGGDEFVLLLDGLADEARMADIVNRVLHEVSQPMTCCPQAPITASIGVSTYGRDALDALAMMRHADHAMYQAKGAGGNCFVLYHPADETAPSSVCTEAI